MAWRYVGGPFMDATVLKVGEQRQQALSGEGSAIESATIRFEDGHTTKVAADGLLPGGPNYSVHTPDGETWCESAAEITDAIAKYVESGAKGASLNKVSVVFMPPGQRTGNGRQLSPAEFYVA